LPTSREADYGISTGLGILKNEGTGIEGKEGFMEEIKRTQKEQKYDQCPNKLSENTHQRT
jgi:hypothetical protein